MNPDNRSADASAVRTRYWISGHPVHIPSSDPFHSLPLHLPNLPNYLLPCRISGYHSRDYEDVTPCSLLAAPAIYFQAGILLGLL
jgi:hypothetical protein